MNGNFSYKTIGRHLLIWISYIFYEASIIISINPAQIHWCEMLIGFCLNASVFYVCAEFIFPKWFSTKGIVILIPMITATIVVYLVASYLISDYIFPLLSPGDPVLAFNTNFLAQFTWRISWFIGLALGYWFAKKSVKTVQILRKLEREQFLKRIREQELQKEIIVSQLIALKNQINPHFLFNTLNFFYSSIWPLSKTLAASLQKLSDIMRYSIKHTNPDGLADLPTEIEQVNNYIDLNQLRYPGKLFVDFKIIGIAEQKKILAAAMMTLVENAFKYGDLTDPENPLIINLNVQFQTFEFNIRNKKNDAKDLERNGIGLINLKKRLELVYSDTYSIDFQEDRIMFNCILKINMTDG